MSGRNKGFDPLASLFEPPDINAGLVPVDDGEDDAEAAPSGQDSFNDPMVKRPSEAKSRGSLPDLDVPDPSGEVPVLADPALEEKVALARRLAMEALARHPSVSAPVVPAPAPPPVPAAPAAPPPIDKEQLARRLAAAAQAAARASSSSSPPPPPPPKAGSVAPKAPAPAAASAKPAPPAAAPPKPAAAKKSSLADRARQPVGAAEAARLASQKETSREVKRRVEATAAKESHLSDIVQELIPHWLPGVGSLVVENAIAVRQRDVLRALWRGHRARFLSQGQLERAVGAAAVLGALDQSSEGALVAVHALTQASDYLVWLDLDKRTLVAAFPDARSFFTGAN